MGMHQNWSVYLETNTAHLHNHKVETHLRSKEEQGNQAIQTKIVHIT
jgi:hypothetical protein